MSRIDHSELAVPFNPRTSDDPFHRIQVLAESRARRNGLDPHAAGRAAMALLKMEGAHAKLEHILRTVAGPYRKA